MLHSFDCLEGGSSAARGSRWLDRYDRVFRSAHDRRREHSVIGVDGMARACECRLQAERRLRSSKRIETQAFVIASSARPADRGNHAAKRDEGRHL